jgi:hypothetical protein
VKTCESWAEVVMATAALGTMYGATTGAIYGAARLVTFGWLGLFAAGVGLILGAIGGLIAGVIAGAMILLAGVRNGGVLGWGIGGFVPGIIWIVLTLPGGETDIVWDVIPTLIGGALGLATGVGVQEGKSILPGVNWLSRTINEAVSRERR